MTVNEVAIAIKFDAYQFWCDQYKEAAKLCIEAPTQYCTDAGYLFLWRRFPDWWADLLLHDALDALKEDDYNLVVLGDNNADVYSVGTWDYFKLRAKLSITYEGGYY